FFTEYVILKYLLPL
ncbi:stress response small protein YobI, partial [Escherichia coli]